MRSFARFPLFRRSDLRWLLPGTIFGVLTGHVASLLLCYYAPAKPHTIRRLDDGTHEVELISLGRRTVVHTRTDSNSMNIPTVRGSDLPRWPRGAAAIERSLIPQGIGASASFLPVYEQELGFPFPQLYCIGVPPNVNASGLTLSGSNWSLSSTAKQSIKLNIPLLPISGLNGTASILLEEPIGGRMSRLTPISVCLNSGVYAVGTIFMLGCIVMLRRAWRQSKGRCPYCAYDQSGLPVNAPCPECGEGSRPRQIITPNDAGIPAQPEFHRVEMSTSNSAGSTPHSERTDSERGG